MMITNSLFSHLDIAKVADEISVTIANEMLNRGWLLLAVITASDQYGSYPCFILGKPRAEITSAYEEKR